MKRTLIITGILCLLIGGGFLFLSSDDSPTDRGVDTRRPDRSHPRASTEAEILQRSLQGEQPLIEPSHDANKHEVRILELWNARQYDEAASRFGLWLVDDVESALDFLGAMKLPYTPTHFGDVTRAHLETLAPARAMELSLRVVCDHYLQEHMVGGVYRKWLENDPQAALEWVNQNGNQAFVENLAETTALEGLYGEPGEALEWMVKLKESAARSRMVKGVLLQWLDKEPEKAVDYLNASERSPAYDQAIMSYATKLIEKNPETAQLWAQSIESESLKSILLPEILARLKDSR